MNPNKTKTFREVQEEYKQLGEDSVHAGFRNAVEAMLRDGFEGSFSNDCYSDALVLTQKMLSRCEEDLRVLSGAEADSFFQLLEKPLRKSLAKIAECGGQARFVLISETEGSINAPFLMGLAKEFPDIVLVALARSEVPLAHFMVADSNMVRVEEKHGKLDGDSPENAIKAKVYFDECVVSRHYITIFDKVWTSLRKKP